MEAHENTALRDLPPAGWTRLRMLIRRAARRRCPECGGGGIFRDWFSIIDRCPRCGYEFAREGGYFLGAYALNLIVAEIIPITLTVILLAATSYSWATLEIIIIPLVIGMPLVLFPFARTFWMAFDLMLTPVNQR